MQQVSLLRIRRVQGLNLEFTPAWRQPPADV